MSLGRHISVPAAASTSTQRSATLVIHQTTPEGRFTLRQRFRAVSARSRWTLVAVVLTCLIAQHAAGWSELRLLYSTPAVAVSPYDCGAQWRGPCRLRFEGPWSFGRGVATSHNHGPCAANGRFSFRAETGAGGGDVALMWSGGESQILNATWFAAGTQLMDSELLVGGLSRLSQQLPLSPPQVDWIRLPPHARSIHVHVQAAATSAFTLYGLGLRRNVSVVEAPEHARWSGDERDALCEGHGGRAEQARVVEYWRRAERSLREMMREIMGWRPDS